VEFEIEFVEGDSPADIEIALSGAPSPSSFVKLNEHLVGDARFRAGMKILADLSKLDVSDLPPDGVQDLSDTVVERDWYRMPAAVAIVAPDEEAYNAALLYRAHLGGSKSNRQVFRSRPEALAWLQAQKAE
jgi:hypothetical protein